MGLTIRLGVKADGGGVSVDFARPHHIALAGMSRSGKSTLSYRILGGLSDKSNVLVTGIDPSGILFAPFVNHRGADMRAVGVNPTAYLSVIDLLVAEMDKRIRSLVDIDKGIFKDKITEFTPNLPLIIVVLEEYPAILSVIDTLNSSEKNRFRLNIRRLIQESAKVSIRLVVLAQRLDAAIIGGAERSNFAVRITHRLDNAEGIRMLHSDVTPELIKQVTNFAPGMAVIDSPLEERRIFRGYFTPYEDYAAHVFQAGKVGDHAKT